MKSGSTPKSAYTKTFSFPTLGSLVMESECSKSQGGLWMPLPTGDHLQKAWVFWDFPMLFLWKWTSCWMHENRIWDPTELLNVEAVKQFVIFLIRPGKEFWLWVAWATFCSKISHIKIREGLFCATASKGLSLNLYREVHALIHWKHLCKSHTDVIILLLCGNYVIACTSKIHWKGTN